MKRYKRHPAAGKLSSAFLICTQRKRRLSGHKAWMNSLVILVSLFHYTLYIPFVTSELAQSPEHSSPEHGICSEIRYFPFT